MDVGPSGRMTAKGKERAGPLGPNVSTWQATIRESTLPETAPQSQTGDIVEPSVEQQVSSEQLEALWKQVKAKSEYHSLLCQLHELNYKTDKLTILVQRRQSKALTQLISRGPCFNKHTTEYYGKSL